MKFHTQLVNDDSIGQRGSCYPTAIACLLDLELHQVPNFQIFYFYPEQEKRIQKYFLKKTCKGSYKKADKDSQDNYDRKISAMHWMWRNCLDYFLIGKGYEEKWIPKKSYKKWLKKNKVRLMISI